MEERTTEAERLGLGLGLMDTDNPLDVSERSKRMNKRLDYTEYSHDEEEETGQGNKRGRGEKKAKPRGNMASTARKMRTRFSEEEVADMWLFIIYRLRDPITQKVLKPKFGAGIWKEFKKENASPRNAYSFYVHFRRSMMPSIDSTNFDMQTKTLIHYTLEIPVSDMFLQELRDIEKVQVVIDKKRLLKGYRKCRYNGYVEDDGWDDVWGPEYFRESDLVEIVLDAPFITRAHNDVSDDDDDDDDDDDEMEGGLAIKRGRGNDDYSEGEPSKKVVRRTNKGRGGRGGGGRRRAPKTVPIGAGIGMEMEADESLEAHPEYVTDSHRFAKASLSPELGDLENIDHQLFTIQPSRNFNGLARIRILSDLEKQKKLTFEATSTEVATRVSEESSTESAPSALSNLHDVGNQLPEQSQLFKVSTAEAQNKQDLEKKETLVERKLTAEVTSTKAVIPVDEVSEQFSIESGPSASSHLQVVNDQVPAESQFPKVHKVEARSGKDFENKESFVETMLTAEMTSTKAVNLVDKVSQEFSIASAQSVPSDLHVVVDDQLPTECPSLTVRSSDVEMSEEAKEKSLGNESNGEKAAVIAASNNANGSWEMKEYGPDDIVPQKEQKNLKESTKRTRKNRTKLTIGRWQPAPATLKRLAKLREESVRQSGIWYTAHLALSVAEKRSTMPEEADNIRKLTKFLEKIDKSGDPKYYSAKIPLNTDFPNTTETIIKHLRKQLLGSSTESPECIRHLTVEKLPKISQTGPLLMDIPEKAEEIVKQAEKLMTEGVNAVFKPEKLKHPEPRRRKEWDDGEREMYHQLGYDVTQRFERERDHIRLPAPNVCIANKEELMSDALKQLAMSAPITNITGIDKALGIDLSIFSLETIRKCFPELMLDVYYQCPQTANNNRYETGEKNWKTWHFESKMSIGKYEEYYKKLEKTAENIYGELVNSPESEMEEKFSNFLETMKNEQLLPVELKRDFVYSKFATNINLNNEEKFRKQMEVIEKLPTFLQPHHDGNLLNLAETILGVNSVQLFVKPPGARTSAHVENLLMACISWNVGPGTCVRFAVSYKYYGKVLDLVKKKRGLTFHGENYWPSEEELLKAGIPFRKFEQKAGELVYVNSGCIYWGQSNGFCVNLEWNVGEPSVFQLAMSMAATSHDAEEKHNGKIPLVDMLWRAAENKLYLDNPEMTQLVRSCMIRSLAATKFYSDYLEAENVDVPRLDNEGGAPPRCITCGEEVFNIVCSVVKKEDPDTVIMKNGVYRDYCSGCPVGELNDDEMKSFYRFYDIEKLIEIYNNYHI
ncbi:unnamed protein product [Caenorhabditis sp. 36 PRJEB53466]|nr:unnamed protein product [Caenorhabditis sp. 36 PRJEB53466]